METIGIVDDDDDSNLLLSSLLEEKYRVNSFIDAEQALDYFQKDPPNLIFLDISMPGLSGEEVLIKLREIEAFKQTPIIALTGYALPEDRNKFLSKGFDEYLAKPITDTEKLFRLVENALKE